MIVLALPLSKKVVNLVSIFNRTDLTVEEKWVHHFGQAMEGVVIHFSPLTSLSDPLTHEEVSELLAQINRLLGKPVLQSPQSPVIVLRQGVRSIRRESLKEHV